MNKIVYRLCAAGLALLLTGCTQSEPSQSRLERRQRLMTTAPPITPVATPTYTEPSTAQTLPEEMPTEPLHIESRSKVEIFEELSIDQLCKGSNVTFTNGSTLINTHEFGTHTVTAQYIWEGIAQSQELTYTVSDTTPPTVLKSGDGAVVPTGAPLNLHDIISIGDNYDHAPTLEYTGVIDTMTPGKYPIKATAVDAAGNRTTWSLNVIVGGTESTPVYPQLGFASLLSQYDRSKTKFGIDVSEWQGFIDYNTVRSAGCDFVMIRLGFSDGDTMNYDTSFTYNLQSAKAAGLATGVYYYSDATTPEEGRAHARAIIDALDGTKLEMPVAFDWEHFDQFMDYDINLHDLYETYRAFEDTLEEEGYHAMIYTKGEFIDPVWNHHQPIWKAFDTDSRAKNAPCRMEQVSPNGFISGVPAAVDLNVVYLK